LTQLQTSAVIRTNWRAPLLLILPVTQNHFVTGMQKRKATELFQPDA
jgi:hypothetical protein